MKTIFTRRMFGFGWLVAGLFTAGLADDILMGRRTGFAFWVDGEQPARKVLATIRKISVTRNDYYDGPFDQLADNYVDQTHISKWMERAIPSIKGRIDKYGYYTDVERASRVALSCYGTYYTQADILEFVKKAKAAADPYHYISRGGVPLPSELAAIYGTNWARAYASGSWSNVTNAARSRAPAGMTNEIPRALPATSATGSNTVNP